MMVDGKGGLLSQQPRAHGFHRSSLHSRRRWRRQIVTILLTALVVAIVNVESTVDFITRSRPIAQNGRFFEGLNRCYEARDRIPGDQQPSKNRVNPRWNPVSGQQTAIVIRNATLFDGETTRDGFFDILFDSGVIRSIFPASLESPTPKDARVIDAHGRFVTPGLVDMHSHHLLLPFPQLPSTSDVNERPLLGPLTPFVRSVDGFKPYDPAIKIIASGGVTSSLIPPGSANIIGGEAYMVKNLPLSGADGEPVVEELLLEHGIPEFHRQRYLKMACGENPKGIYHHTRLGLIWLLREKLEEARQLQERQSTWCQAAFDIAATKFGQDRRISSFLESEGSRPESFELATLVDLLRGDLNVNVHCYEPEDLERMLSVLHEFDIHPRAFHHALEAWQVPELLKHLEENVTIATFAENGLYKAEAYGANLRGPRILDDHGIRVALKSDHTGEGNYAKYLVYQASVSHSFGLSEDRSLQSVTSIPAHSVQQGHRIGYVRPGYDADLVIWDDHPLQVGATPVEVFIDGRQTLRNDVLEQSLPDSAQSPQAPVIRPSVAQQERDEICGRIQGSHSKLLFTGIKKVLIDMPHSSDESVEDLVLLLENGQISCLGKEGTCIPSGLNTDDVVTIPLKNGFITPGLVAFGNNLGIQAIPSETSTGDGVAQNNGGTLDEEKAVHFAKYGVHLHGKAFTRARIGGVTKAITAPRSGGSIQGVSVGLRTSETITILDGGIWKDEVALHLIIGQSARGDDTPTVSSGVEHLRTLLQRGEKHGAEGHGVYTRAANGSLPIVVQAFNEDDIAKLILIKRDFPSANLILYGGHAAVLVAKPLAEAGIPVILTGNRGAPDSWEKRHIFTGPPLTESPAKILNEAGVLIGLAVKGDSQIHGLAQEARWAGKYAGLNDQQAIALVSTNIEAILGTGLEKSQTGDFVVWEGNPLRGEGSVVVSVQDDGKIADCWPDTTNAVL